MSEKIIEALTLLRESIDMVGKAATETANNPRWRYHRDTPHMKTMAGVYAEWAAAVQVIIDNLPSLSHAAGQEVVLGSDGWRPIESAPKDGRRVLAFAGARPFIAWYESGRIVGWWDDNDLMRDPTHWRPLPDSPASQDQEGGK